MYKMFKLVQIQNLTKRENEWKEGGSEDANGVDEDDEKKGASAYQQLPHHLRELEGFVNILEISTPT